MRRKIHLKKERKNYKLNIIILIVTIIIICIILSFRFINKKIMPNMLDYAEIETNKIATIVISKAINNEVINQIDLDDLFITSTDTSGNINIVDFNPVIVNKMIGMITLNVHEYLKKLEMGKVDELGINDVSAFASKNKLKKGIIYEIPTGVIFDNVILSNIGPKIPVKLSLIGDVSTNYKTDVTNYGINNALIKLIITVDITEQVILPFKAKQVKVQAEIPLALKLVQGVVPNYYFNGAVVPNISSTNN